MLRRLFICKVLHNAAGHAPKKASAMSSSSMRPLSPPRPSSASVTTTTVSTSPPTSASRSIAGTGGAATTTASSSVSTHHHQHHHHFHPPVRAPNPAPDAASTTPATAPPPHVPPRRRQNSASTPTGAFPPVSPTNPSQLPTESQQAQIAQARAALVASIGNALDTELQTRASLLHANQAAIEKQEHDVERALRDLRKEDDKLMKVLNDGSRKVKELGDVQNWAERLERDFLVLEETMRLVDRGQRRGSFGSGSVSGSWPGSESGSGSWSGSDRASVMGNEDDEGDVQMQDRGDENDFLAVEETLDKGKGKQAALPLDAMQCDPAQIPLPSENDATNNPNETKHAEPIEQRVQTTTQTSPPATSWLKKFIWWTPA